MYRLDTDEIEHNFIDALASEGIVEQDGINSVLVTDKLHLYLYNDIVQEFWFELKLEINEYLQQNI